ncbi:hypothetical protein KCU64_g8016, partial [Aureobasidium melanogenum]
MSSLFAWTKAACLLLLASEAFASPIEKFEELEKRAVCTAYSGSCHRSSHAIPNDTDPAHGLDVAAHLSYKSDANVQNQGIKFVLGKLRGTS